MNIKAQDKPLGNKILSLIVGIALRVAAIPLSVMVPNSVAYAEEGTQEISYTQSEWLIDENGHCDIPDGTTYVSAAEFARKPNIRSVTMPDSVNRVYAGPGGIFQDCKNLESVTLSKNLTYLPQYTFKG